MNPEVALYFRDQFRSARAEAHSDAEGYQAILFALERFGSHLCGSVGGLGAYTESVAHFAEVSPLAEEIPKQQRGSHIPFADLYKLVKDARNDALHHGAFARHLTSHAIQLAIVLEDALMSDARSVSDYMIRDVTCASPWQPLSFVRQQMLANSFSYLPIVLGTEAAPQWNLIADVELARYLRVSNTQRKIRLAKTISQVLEERAISFSVAQTCGANAAIEEILPQFNGQPVLVVEGRQLLGIVTAFDLL